MKTNKASCSLCKKSNNSPEQIDDSIILFCTECMERVFHSLSEDWKFEPTTASGMYKMSNPKYTMTNMKSVEPEEDIMPDYKYSIDPSMAKSDQLQKKIGDINMNNSGDVIKYDSPENTPGA